MQKITPNQALAYVRRTVGGPAVVDDSEAFMVFQSDLFVPLDEDIDALNDLCEALAEREGCALSHVFSRIAQEPVVQLDEVGTMRVRKRLEALANAKVDVLFRVP